MSSVSFFLPPTVDPDKWNPLQRFNTPVMFIFPAKMFPGQVDLVGFLIVQEFSETKFNICFHHYAVHSRHSHTPDPGEAFPNKKSGRLCLFITHWWKYHHSHIMTFSFQNVDQRLSLNGAHTLPSVCFHFYARYNSVTKTNNKSISFSHSLSSVMPVYIWENGCAWFFIRINYASSHRNSTGRARCLISPAVTAAFYPTSAFFSQTPFLGHFTDLVRVCWVGSISLVLCSFRG